MSRLVWGDPVKSIYETGIDRGVFYPQGGTGVPWNGLIAVSEAPSGSDLSEGHYDGEKFRQQRRSGSFSAKITAFTYPKEFTEYDGFSDIGLAQQGRKMFNLTYRTRLGSDSNPDDSYLIHLVYNAVVSPASPTYTTAGSSVQPANFEWNLETIPEFLPSGEMTAHLVVNTQMAYSWAVEQLEEILYGTGWSDPRFPTISEVLEIFENGSILKITDHGDGTWTADGPDEAIQMLSDTEFEITWPSAVWIDTDTYSISSL
jgi:hypothetical protein